MGAVSQGSRAFAAAGRRAVAVARAILQTLLQTALFAAAIALVVWLLPGKLPVALLTLYGFICVGLLQFGAAAILLLTLVRAMFSTDARGDVIKALSICGGFLIVIALCNAYILALAQAWGRDFGLSVHHIALNAFLTADNQIIGVAGSAGAATIAFIDRIAVVLLPLSQPPLQRFLADIALSISRLVTNTLGGTAAGLPTKVLALGALTGVVLTTWARLATGKKGET